MRRLIEWSVGLCIIATMAAASFSSPKPFFGSWGAEASPEALMVWKQYSEVFKRQYKYPPEMTLLRSSAPVFVFDEKECRNVKAVKFEFHWSFSDSLAPVGRRDTYIIAYDGGRIVHRWWEGKAPKEYREAF